MKTEKGYLKPFLNVCLGLCGVYLLIQVLLAILASPKTWEIVWNTSSYVMQLMENL